ncbi:MAG: DUF488 domain-containing protein [Sorangiineae bacterium]|nr:DUF488 domain-containing protein [Polyangiaceae bacterium]MEB2322471.1 DUF488 domain-containing protein [Sorangiineae bacterium]
MKSAAPPELWTIGHSTRSLDELVELLRAHRVELVADVRTVPRSRTNPQFNLDVLPDSLALARIGYQHLAALGGLRHARKDSKSLGWENASFRGFADYMQTPEFHDGLAELEALAAKRRVAIMCAEAVPWRCHRRMIADAWVARGGVVHHIMSVARADLHTLTPFARVRGGHVTYPASHD